MIFVTVTTSKEVLVTVIFLSYFLQKSECVFGTFQQ